MNTYKKHYLKNENQISEKIKKLLVIDIKSRINNQKKKLLPLNI